MPFIGHLSVERLESGEWVLLAPLEYASKRHGMTVTVPQGFTTDFASVPRLPFAYALFGDRGHKAAVIHDYLYATKSVSRSVADSIFKEALSEIEPGWRAWAMWLGVRIGGWWIYNKD